MPSQDERRSSSAVAAAMTSSPGSRSQIVAGAALADDAELARLRVCAHFRFINTQFPLFRRVTVTQIPVVGPYGLRRLLTTVGVIDASTRYAAYCRLADHFASVEPARAGRNGDQAYVVEAAPYVSGDHVDTNGYSPTMASGSDWTAEENAVLVRAYLDMLRLELSGHPYNKAEMNRRTASQISRSRSSIEYKQRNVSWALFEVSHPFIDGYKPARNLQDALRHEVLRQLDLADDLLDLAFKSLQSAAALPRMDLVWSIAGAPDIEFAPAAPRSSGRRVDFVRIEAENRRLGLAGEQAVLRREQDELRRLGRSDLARQVEHVSQTVGDGLGYDILSFDESGSQKYVEVKTTRRGKQWPMLITRGEVAFSQVEAERFHLYRVHDFTAARAGLYVLQGDVTKTCQLSPESFKALPA